MTPDLSAMTKDAINTLLAAPLTVSQLKKTSHLDLVAMFDAMNAADALDADRRDVRTDDTPPTPDQVGRDESNHFGIDADAPEPSMQVVLESLTAYEKNVLVAHLEAGIACNCAETLDAMRQDNMTWSDTTETATRTGLTRRQITALLASLSGKGLVVTDCDPVNGEGPVQQVLSDFGIVVAFELMAEGTEAKAAPKPVRAPRLPKVEKPKPKPRVVEDRIIVAPANDLKMVRPTGEGSKRHLLAQALLRGATIEHLMEVTGWNKSTATSALRWDIPQMGLGVRREGEKYFLILPAGVNMIPVRAKDMTRADALVAACK